MQEPCDIYRLVISDKFHKKDSHEGSMVHLHNETNPWDKQASILIMPVCKQNPSEDLLS